MIGDLIPAGIRHWKLYLCLRKIIDILFSPALDIGQVQTVKLLIMKHNKKYLQLFGTLKPKMHIRLHYPRAILLNGPVVYFSTMKYERKHRELKDTAVGTSSNLNLPLTIAIRHQLKLCYNIEFCPSIHRELVLGPVDNYKANSQFRISIPHFSSDIPVKTLQNVEILGNKFSVGTTCVTRITENGPQFGVIKTIFYCKHVYFEAKEFTTVSFNHQYHAFQVQCNTIKPNLLINVDLMPKMPPCLMCKKNNEDFVATRYSIKKCIT